MKTSQTNPIPFPKIFRYLLISLLSAPAVAFAEMDVSSATMTGAAVVISTDAIAISSVTLPEPKTDSAIDRKLIYERYARANPFVLTPHRPNYFIPAAYNFTPNYESFEPSNPDERMRKMEVKFQLSFKVNLVRELIKNRADLYAAYTQQSFWQTYTHSSPFRETNHEPELGLAMYNNLHFLGIRNRIITLAVSHQSNGRGGELSRSWNRVFAELLFQRGNVYVNLRPWYRLPEPSSSDDNPDIDKYMGHGELYINYALKNQVFGIMLRNNMRSENKGAVQLDWTFPLLNQFKGYIQFFNGYGESLVDYNHINRRIGVGFSLSNWI